VRGRGCAGAALSTWRDMGVVRVERKLHAAWLTVCVRGDRDSNILFYSMSEFATNVRGCCGHQIDRHHSTHHS
jgi:hypothetical protein